MRVAFAGFLHETNTFAPVPADREAFRLGGGYIPMCGGADMIAAAEGVNLGISGALRIAREAGWEAVPLLWAGAIPSAHVTRDAFGDILGEIVARLEAAGPVDGLFLDLHGAMVARHLDDGEAEIAARLRAVVGPGVPIVAALDLHGNLSARFVACVDAAVGFRTYPHVDMAETGARAARLLGPMMAGAARPVAAFRPLPYLVPIPFQSTDLEPARGLYALIDTVEAEGAVSASLFMGFPAADIPDCGPSVLAYAATRAEAEAAADRIARAYDAAEPDFVQPVFDAAGAVAEAQRLAGAGPVVIADTQDNPGAGGVSATTGLLRALLSAGAEDAAIGLIVDPRAAAQAHAAGVGARATFRIGGHPGLPDAPPLVIEAEVEALSDGQCHATGPYYGGTRLDLGPSACLRAGGVRIAVSSRIAQMADREMFRFVGIVPEDQSILVVKSSTHFRADFAPVARAILIACAPGPMPLDPGDLPFTRLRPDLRMSPGGPSFASWRAAQGAAAILLTQTATGSTGT